MFGTIYTALAGMTAYSQGLDVISNNVANLNTPGFKASDPLFREIVYRHMDASGSRGGGQRPTGAGVEAQTSTLVMRQGDLRDTGNMLDVAIDGNGLFVLDGDEGEYHYTRAGQFEFNDEGFLVEKGTGAKVIVSTGEMSVSHFDIDPKRSFPPKATSEVLLVGTLARTGTTTTYELPNVNVFDSAGTAIPLRAKLTRNATDPLRWTVEVLNAANTVLGSGQLVFAADGTPSDGGSTVTVTVDATGVDDFPITLNFGAAGSFAGVTTPASSTASQLQVLKQNGYQAGSLTRSEFDDRGQLKLTYSNGQTDIAAQLVLAQFDAPEQLRPLGNGLFAAAKGVPPILGRGLNAGLGRIVGQKLEMSNVELTQQFTDLIIMQRGYQASSQMSSVANELIQTLLAMDRK